MVAGGPGDHPLTDILNWNRTVFGPEIDGFVKELAEMENFSAVEDDIAQLLMDHDPTFGNPKSDPVFVLQELRRIRVQLEKG